MSQRTNRSLLKNPEILATLLPLPTRRKISQMSPTMFLIIPIIQMGLTTPLMGQGATMLPMEPMIQERPTLQMFPMSPSTPSH